MAKQEVPEQPKQSNFWKPESKGEKKEGVYVRMEAPREGKEKFGNTFVIREPSGHEISLPNHGILMAKMRQLRAGVYVWIEYTGKEKKEYTYKVEFDPDHKSQAALTTDQGRLTDAPADTTPITKIITNLRDGSKWFPDGIPLTNINQAIVTQGFTGAATEEMFKSLKDKGLIIEAVAGFYKVV